MNFLFTMNPNLRYFLEGGGVGEPRVSELFY